MKVLSKLCLLFSLLWANIAQAALLSVNESEINHYLATRLAEKFSLTNRVGVPNLFQLDYQISDLHASIGRNEQKSVEIAGIVSGLLKARNKEYDANIQLNLDAIPYFDAEKGAIFLKDVRLLNWQATPQKYQRELQMFLPLLFDGVNAILNSTPVYTLDESNMKEALVKKFGKAIVVEEGKLRLETKIF